jgi:4-hydroxybenzoate polyprenyltransferase
MDPAKLKRLWQPQRLLFWQMLMFDVLSSACAWALNTLPLNSLGLGVVGLLGLMNVGFGLLAAWALLREEAK